MSKCLFIGGPKDGEWYDVDETLPEIRVALEPPDMTIASTTYYTRTRLRDDAGFYTVYVYGDCGNLINRLLEGYMSIPDRAEIKGLRVNIMHGLKYKLAKKFTGYVPDTRLTHILEEILK